MPACQEAWFFVLFIKYASNSTAHWQSLLLDSATVAEPTGETKPSYLGKVILYLQGRTAVRGIVEIELLSRIDW